jgi:hypothetical protein
MTRKPATVARARKRPADALAEQMQRLFADHTAACHEWTPIYATARAHVGGTVSADNHKEVDALTRKAGGEAIQRRINSTHNQLEKLMTRAKRLPVETVTDLRPLLLTVLYEMRPIQYEHEGHFSFPDDGGATRTLFDAAAKLAGLAPFVASMDAALSADASKRNGGAK